MRKIQASITEGILAGLLKKTEKCWINPPENTIEHA
jgi:hypothetical protein